MTHEREIELMRLRRMIADRNDFITSKGLWREFYDYRPNEDAKPPTKKDMIDHILKVLGKGK